MMCSRIGVLGDSMYNNRVKMSTCLVSSLFISVSRCQCLVLHYHGPEFSMGLVDENCGYPIESSSPSLL